MAKFATTIDLHSLIMARKEEDDIKAKAQAEKDKERKLKQDAKNQTAYMSKVDAAFAEAKTANVIYAKRNGKRRSVAFESLYEIDLTKDKYNNGDEYSVVRKSDNKLMAVRQVWYLDNGYGKDESFINAAQGVGLKFI